MSPAEIAASLTPLERGYFADMCKRGSTRTDEGGLADTILSGLCSKPSMDGAIVRWEMNRDERARKWPNKYLPTELGLEVYATMEGGS